MHNDVFLCSQLIRRCRDSRNLWQAKRVHAHLVERELASVTFVANLLVEMYGKCGSVAEAWAVFDSTREPNLFSWTNMLTAYAQNGHLLQAQEMFGQMPERDSVSWNTMLRAYTSNKDMSGAKRFFASMPVRDIVSWTTLLAAFARTRYLEEAEYVFRRMPERDPIAYNAMMQGFLDSRKVVEACEIFKTMPWKDVASWTTMVTAYTQDGHLLQARRYFDKMPKTNIVSWTSILVSYAESGNLLEAGRIFDRMPGRNLIAWNAMIQAYAQNGHARLGLRFFGSMALDGVRPNEVTFISVFTACSHIGLVQLARGYVFSMLEDHGIALNWRHFSCIVDLLGRAGWLAQAEELATNTLAFCPVVWKSLFASCQSHGDLKRGKRIATRLIEFEKEQATHYVMLSNIYSQVNITEGPVDRLVSLFDKPLQYKR